jgi:hypothetical protein
MSFECKHCGEAGFETLLRMKHHQGQCEANPLVLRAREEEAQQAANEATRARMVQACAERLGAGDPLLTLESDAGTLQLGCRFPEDGQAFFCLRPQGIDLHDEPIPMMPFFLEELRKLEGRIVTLDGERKQTIQVVSWLSHGYSSGWRTMVTITLGPGRRIVVEHETEEL